MDKQNAVEALKEKGVEADVSMHHKTLEKMLKVTSTTPINTVTSETPTPEATVPLSQVEKMIADALANFKESEKPVKVKRVTEHFAHLWRLDGKWVVDFKDRNTDPYVKEKVHSFQKYNEQLREYQAWIELVYHDGTTKELPLTSYLINRHPVYCPIIKRHQIDKSYSIGEVEIKKEVGDKLVGTGKMRDQEVYMVDEVFELKTPEGTTYMVPAHAIC